MKLINGVVFGAGLGLIMTGLDLTMTELNGVTDAYKPALFAIGSLFITIEMTRIFFGLTKKS